MHLWVPCPRCRGWLRRGRDGRPRGWGCHRRARRAFLPVMHLRMSEHDTSGRRPLTRRWRRHRTHCRSPVTRFVRSISNVPHRIRGELSECPELTDFPTLFLDAGCFPADSDTGSPLAFKLSVGVTGHAYLLEIAGLFTPGSRPGRTVGESVGEILELDSSAWSNGIRYHIIDTRPDTEFKNARS